MKFGKVEDAGLLDLSLPKDHADTQRVLLSSEKKEKPRIFVGCAKWNKKDLKNFYPKGTKDELAYYSSQFNCIELNATFYRVFPKAQFEKWKEKTPEDFRFFPKLVQNISHWGRLKDTNRVVDEVVHAFGGLEEKLGHAFLQMHTNFSPKDFDRVVKFVEYWPSSIPLTVEFRHTDWYNDAAVAQELYQLLETNNIGNTITDTAGRRDLLHMRLTTPNCFVRYTGANHPSDKTRLDDWIERLKRWTEEGIEEIDFFIHQNIEVESPLLAAYFIKKLNATLG
ncbi:MAG: DUF72 domain-containing protein, partial [Flavobacteriales bacterium]|nr:DUF72 domain-containing protein [Flavobacteriales bacterium]